MAICPLCRGTRIIGKYPRSMRPCWVCSTGYDEAHKKAQKGRNEMLERLEREGEKAARELQKRLGLPDDMRVQFGGKGKHG